MKTVHVDTVIDLKGEKQIKLKCLEDVEIILSKQAVLDIISYAIGWPGVGIEAKAIITKANSTP